MRSIPLARFVAVMVPPPLCTPELIEALDRHPAVVSPVTSATYPNREEVIVPLRPVHDDVPPAVVRDDARKLVADQLDGVAPGDLEASVIRVGPSVHDAAYEALEALRKALEALPVHMPLMPPDVQFKTLADDAAYPIDQIARMVANHEHWRCPGSAQQRTQP